MTTTTRRQVAEAMRRFEGRERIPLPDLLGPLGLTRLDRHRLVAAGLISPLPERGPHGAYQVDQDQAEQILRGVMIATAIGAGVAIVLRVLAAA